jgi:hypothetical protein
MSVGPRAERRAQGGAAAAITQTGGYAAIWRLRHAQHASSVLGALIFGAACSDGPCAFGHTLQRMQALHFTDVSPLRATPPPLPSVCCCCRRRPQLLLSPLGKAFVIGEPPSGGCADDVHPAIRNTL